MRSISTMIVDDGGVGVATTTGEDAKPVANYYNEGQEEEEEEENDENEEMQENDLVIDDGQQHHFASAAAATGNSSGNDTDSETYSSVSGAFSLAALNGGRRKQHKPIRYPTLTQPFFFVV